MKEKVSGNIYAEKNSWTGKDEEYTIINPVTGQGWGIPTRDITPEDLRRLADRLEKVKKDT